MSNQRTQNKRGNGEPPKEEAKQERSAPVFSRRCWTGSGSVEVAIFEKEIEGDNGQYMVYNTVAKRSFKTDAGYDSSNAFRPEDLLILALFLQEAASWICTQQSKR